MHNVLLQRTTNNGGLRVKTKQPKRNAASRASSNRASVNRAKGQT